MLEFNELLRKYEIKPKKYSKINKVFLIDTNDKKFVIKKKNTQNNEIFKFLKYRNFDYLPFRVNNDNEKYEITNYINNIEIPKEQKILDLIDLVSLLHNKTTHYKEVTEDDYKEIYEDISNNIEHLYTYYSDIITVIESKVYMSPSEYVLARNISKIFQILNFIKNELEEWLKLVKEKNKQRLVVLHNNLELNHLIINEKNYLISWDKSKVGIPIFDIYKLYIRHSLELDFDEVFKRYLKNYPLYEEEKKLFFILILMPKKIEIGDSEYENTKIRANLIDYLYKTEKFISPYYSNERPKNDNHK